jgi:hypothetical protein
MGREYLRTEPPEAPPIESHGGQDLLVFSEEVQDQTPIEMVIDPYRILTEDLALPVIEEVKPAIDDLLRSVLAEIARRDWPKTIGSMRRVLELAQQDLSGNLDVIDPWRKIEVLRAAISFMKVRSILEG